MGRFQGICSFVLSVETKVEYHLGGERACAGGDPLPLQGAKSPAAAQHHSVHAAACLNKIILYTIVHSTYQAAVSFLAWTASPCPATAQGCRDWTGGVSYSAVPRMARVRYTVAGNSLTAE